MVVALGIGEITGRKPAAVRCLRINALNQGAWRLDVDGAEAGGALANGVVSPTVLTNQVDDHGMAGAQGLRPLKSQKDAFPLASGRVLGSWS